MEPKKLSSIRNLRLAAGDSLIREFSLATGGQGHRHGPMQVLGREVHDLILPLFPVQEGGQPAEAVIQWLTLHDASDDYMTFTVEIYAPHPGGNHADLIIEQHIRGHIESRVAHSGSRDKFEKMKIIAHIL